MPDFESSAAWSSGRTDDSGGFLSGSGLSSPPTSARTASPCASGDEDLKHVLRAVRKAKAQNAPDEQIAPVPRLPPPGLSARIQEVFADQVKSTYSLFKPTKAVSKHIAPDSTNTASKRKDSYDPFAVHTLNIEPSEPLANGRSEKRRRLNQTHKRSQNGSQTPGADPRKQGLGDGSTGTASQIPRSQSPAAASGHVGSSGRQNLVSNRPLRSGTASLDITETNTGRYRINSHQQDTSRNTASTTTLHDLGHPAGRQRSPATHHLLRDASTDGSQAQSEGLHGFIGGRPEKGPSYAHKEANNLNQAVKKAKSRQVEYNSFRKKTTFNKHRPRQSRRSSSPAAEARLLRAQEASVWKETPFSSTQTDLQNGTARPSAVHSQRVSRNSPPPLSRQSKNAKHQPTLQDEDEDLVAISPPHSTLASSSHSQRLSQPLSRGSVTTVPEPALNNDDGLAGPRETPLTADTSQASRQVQQQVRRLPQSMLIPSRPRHAPAQLSKTPKEDLDRATAEMEALRKRYEDKPRTTVLNSVPARYGESASSDVRRSRGRLAKERAKIQVSQHNREAKMTKVIKKREAAIWRGVRAKLGGESQEVQKAEFQRRFDGYLKKKEKEAWGQRGDAPVSTKKFDEDFLEAGHSDKKAHDHHHDIGRKANKIPAPEALEKLGPNGFICTYIVFISGPFSKGESHELIATKLFGELPAASKYARSILEDSDAYSHVISEINEGYYCGRGTLSRGKNKGKDILVEVRMEKEMVGDLSADALRDKFVDGECLAKYTPGYEVFMFSTVPKGLRETKGEAPKKPALEKRQARRAHEANSPAEQTAVEGDEEPTGLEGNELRRALANLPGTCQADAPEESDDGTLSDEETTRAYSPDSELCDQTPRNATDHIDWDIIPLGCFTTLPLANLTAISAATVAWKPKSANYDAHRFYSETILPTIEQYKAYVNKEEIEIVFPELEPGGRVPGHGPWGFSASRIVVFERELQGPQDVPIEYVQDLTGHSSGKSGKNVKETVAQGAAEFGSVGEDDDAGDIEPLNEKVPDRQVSDEEDVSEEE